MTDSETVSVTIADDDGVSQTLDMSDDSIHKLASLVSLGDHVDIPSGFGSGRISYIYLWSDGDVRIGLSTNSSINSDVTASFTWTDSGNNSLTVSGISTFGTNVAPSNAQEVTTFFNQLTNEESSSATLTLTRPAPTLDVKDTATTVREGGTATISVRLSARPTGTVTVSASETDADISLSPSSRSFTTSNWNTYQSFTVTGVHDADTANDSATVSLSASGGGVTNSETVSVTITDDDAAPTLNVEDTTITVQEGGTATIRVRLSARPTGTVTVSASESDADISLSPSSRSFSTSNWNTYQSFTVTGLQDADTVDDSATVSLSASGGGVTDSETVSVTITDDDGVSRTLDMSDDSIYKLTSLVSLGDHVDIPSGFGSGRISYIYLWSNGNVQIGLATNSTINSGVTASFTWTDSGGSSLTVSGITEFGANVTPANTQEVTTFFNQLTNEEASSATLTLTQPAPTLDVEDTTITVQEGGTASIRVRLSGRPTGTVTVSASETDADISLSPSSRSFSTSNWNTYQSFTVSGLQDSDTANDSATVSLSASGGGVTDSETVSITITDDDSAPTLDVEDTTITVQEGGTATISVRLSAQPTGTVTVSASETDADISLSPSSRSFSTSNWNTYQSFTVTGLQDADTANDSATVSLSASGGGVTDSETVSITITDDDTTATISAPQNLKASRDAGDAHVTLSWSSVTGAARYEDRWRESGTTAWGDWTRQINTNTVELRYESNGLVDGTSYQFQVRAIDANGNASGPSNTATATFIKGASQTLNLSDSSINKLTTLVGFWDYEDIPSGFGSGRISNIYLWKNGKVQIGLATNSSMNSGVTASFTWTDSSGTRLTVSGITTFDANVTPSNTQAVTNFFNQLTHEESSSVTLTLSK